MTFPAKYPGKCAICGEKFPAGTQINWRKGEPSSHAACAQKFAEQMDLPAPAPAPQVAKADYVAAAGGPRRCVF